MFKCEKDWEINCVEFSVRNPNATSTDAKNWINERNYIYLNINYESNYNLIEEKELTII